MFVTLVYAIGAIVVSIMISLGSLAQTTSYLGVDRSAEDREELDELTTFTPLNFAFFISLGLVVGLACYFGATEQPLVLGIMVLLLIAPTFNDLRRALRLRKGLSYEDDVF